MATTDKLSPRTRSYLETALWSSTAMVGDDPIVGYPGLREGDPLDDHFGIDDISPESLVVAETELNDFFDYLENQGLLDLAREYHNDECIAHDFWLTRNGHGAGFWDGHYDDRVGGRRSIGRELTDCAKIWGSQYIWIDLGGILHLEG